MRKSTNVWIVGVCIGTWKLKASLLSRREAVRDGIPYFEEYDEAVKAATEQQLQRDLAIAI